MPRAAAKQTPGPILEYRDFLGISHAKDKTRIPKHYLLRAINVDVDVEGMLHRRRGTKLLLPIECHSLWSNEFVCFFVHDGILYQLMEDFSYQKVLADIGPTRMEYADVNGIVFFTNGQIIGYIEDGVAHSFPEVTQTYKAKMVGGQLLEYFDSRLYAVQDDIIFFSDAAKPMVMDIRHNFIQVSGKVRMIKSVVDGLYISEGEHIFFYHLQQSRWAGEHSGDPPVFKRIPIIDVPCFEGMAIKVEGEKISPKVEGVVVVWAGGEGCFMGMPEGKFERLTGRNFFLDAVPRGAATFIVRDLHDGYHPGYPQFLGVYDCFPGHGEGKSKLELPRLVVKGIGKSS